MKQIQKPDYLTDDQLLHLIESLDTDGMHTAPGYLKDKILKKAAQKNNSSRYELFIFGTKIIAAAAASIALLFTMPDPGQIKQTMPGNLLAQEESAGAFREDSFLRQFNRKANKLCGIISDSANSIFQKEETM